MHGSLLRWINNGVMMMEASHAQAYFPLMASLITGKGDPTRFLATSNDHQLPGVFYASGSTALGPGTSSREKRIAVIPLKGAVVKYNEPCGGATGTETIARYIQDAANNPNIDAIVIDCDSPGGMGSAVQAPSQAIRDCGKPILGYTGNGLACSAGYWIISNCDEIYATYSTDEVGSIGTYVTIADVYGYWEDKHKFKAKDVYATKSTRKNKVFIEAIEAVRTGDESKFQSLIKEFIDPFNEAFINEVKTNRPSATDEVYNGTLYFAEDAQKSGLIDGLKTFQQVLERAAELAA